MCSPAGPDGVVQTRIAALAQELDVSTSETSDALRKMRSVLRGIYGDSFAAPVEDATKEPQSSTTLDLLQRVKERTEEQRELVAEMTGNL